MTARYMSDEECAAWYWTHGVPMEQSTEYLAWLLMRWKIDPVCFAVEALRVILQPYQAQILLDLADAPIDCYQFYGLDPHFPKNQVLVPSGHGLGKTRGEAVAIWWHMLTHAFSKRLCTAPTGDQLTGQLWGEVTKMHRRLASAWPMIASDWNVLTKSIEHVNDTYRDWITIARTARADQPEALQGAHALDVDDEFGQLATLFDEEEARAPSGGMLVLIDEASGVVDIVRETVEGSLSESGARFLACGNPTRPDGWFAEALDNTDRYAVHPLDCRMSDQTKIYTLPYRDFGGYAHALRVRGFVPPKYWTDVLAECDGDEDHDRVRVRVRGVKPRSAFNQCLPAPWVADAMEHGPDEESQTEPAIVSLDFGVTTDKHGAAVRQGFNIRHAAEWLPPDKPEDVTLKAADVGIELVRSFGARYLIGDSNGAGRGAMEYLSRYYTERPELDVTVVHFNAGAGAMDRKRYKRRRDEMWYKYGRPFLANPRTHLPKVPGLKSQLTAPQVNDNDDANRIEVESKDDIFKRTGQTSGAMADAVLQTLMVHLPAIEEPKPEPAPAHPPVFTKHFDRWHARQHNGYYIR